MDTIVNPETGKHIYLYSDSGLQILNQYMNTYKGGADKLTSGQKKKLRKFESYLSDNNIYDENFSKFVNNDFNDKKYYRTATGHTIYAKIINTLMDKHKISPEVKDWKKKLEKKYMKNNRKDTPQIDGLFKLLKAGKLKCAGIGAGKSGICEKEFFPEDFKCFLYRMLPAYLDCIREVDKVEKSNMATDIIPKIDKDGEIIHLPKNASNSKRSKHRKLPDIELNKREEWKFLRDYVEGPVKCESVENEQNGGKIDNPEQFREFLVELKKIRDNNNKLKLWATYLLTPKKKSSNLVNPSPEEVDKKIGIIKKGIDRYKEFIEDGLIDTKYYDFDIGLTDEIKINNVLLDNLGISPSQKGWKDTINKVLENTTESGSDDKDDDDTDKPSCETRGTGKLTKLNQDLENTSVKFTLKNEPFKIEKLEMLNKKSTGTIKYKRYYIDIKKLIDRKGSSGYELSPELFDLKPIFYDDTYFDEGNRCFPKYFDKDNVETTDPGCTVPEELCPVAISSKDAYIKQFCSIKESLFLIMPAVIEEKISNKKMLVKANPALGIKTAQMMTYKEYQALVNKNQSSKTNRVKAKFVAKLKSVVGELTDSNNRMHKYTLDLDGNFNGYCYDCGIKLLNRITSDPLGDPTSQKSLSKNNKKKSFGDKLKATSSKLFGSKAKINPICNEREFYTALIDEIMTKFKNERESGDDWNYKELDIPDSIKSGSYGADGDSDSGKSYNKIADALEVKLLDAYKEDEDEEEEKEKVIMAEKILPSNLGEYKSKTNEELIRLLQADNQLGTTENKTVEVADIGVAIVNPDKLPA